MINGEAIVTARTKFTISLIGRMVWSIGALSISSKYTHFLPTAYESQSRRLLCLFCNRNHGRILFLYPRTVLGLSFRFLCHMKTLLRLVLKELTEGVLACPFVEQTCEQTTSQIHRPLLEGSVTVLAFIHSMISS